MLQWAMNNFGLSQLAYISVVNDKGKLPAFSSNQAGACILIGAIMDLVKHGCVKIDKKKVWTTGVAVPSDLQHLISLFDIVAAAKRPMSISYLAGKYLNTLLGRNLDALMVSIGTSLMRVHAVTQILGRKIRFAPHPNAVQSVVAGIRAEQHFALAAILDRAGLLKRLFSKVEYAHIKKRVKWLRTEVKRNPEFAAMRETFEFLDMCMMMFVIIIASSSSASVAASGC